jgi:hypothetical protein
LPSIRQFHEIKILTPPFSGSFTHLDVGKNIQKSEPVLCWVLLTTWKEMHMQGLHYQVRMRAIPSVEK